MVLSRTEFVETRPGSLGSYNTPHIQYISFLFVSTTFMRLNCPRYLAAIFCQEKWALLPRFLLLEGLDPFYITNDEYIPEMFRHVIDTFPFQIQHVSTFQVCSGDSYFE